MSANKRLYFAVKQAGLSPCGEESFTSIKGLQSIGVNTQFNLEQVFEIGQLSLYENIENIPDVEATLEKVLDGYPPIYLLATEGAASASVSGRSNVRSTLGLSVYSDVQDSASGTPLAQCQMSGVYVSSVSYQFNVQGNSTESVTLVGNNKTWSDSFAASAFDNNDEPLAIAGSGGVNRREDVLFGSAGCILPGDIPGISASGTNELTNAGTEYNAHIQSIRVSTNLGREQLFELGRRGPYHRYVNFPIEVTCEFEILSTEGDGVEAFEEDEGNLADHQITIKTREGLVLNLGARNKLSSVNYGGGDAGQQGSNDTATFSYSNFNDLSVYHPQDPTEALRP